MAEGLMRSALCMPSLKLVELREIERCQPVVLQIRNPQKSIEDENASISLPFLQCVFIGYLL